MDNQLILNIVYLLLTGIMVLVDTVVFPMLYFYWIKSGKVTRARMLILLKPFSLAISFYYMFTIYFAGMVMGVVYIFVIPTISICAIIFIIVQIVKSYKIPRTKPGIFNLLLGLALIISSALPPFLYRPVRNQCIDANSSKMSIISPAIDKYFNEKGNYPKQIADLVPDYLSEIPEPSCAFLSGQPREFELNDCKPPYVYVSAVDFMGEEYYNPNDGSRIIIGILSDIYTFSCPKN